MAGNEATKQCKARHAENWIASCRRLWRIPAGADSAPTNKKPGIAAGLFASGIGILSGSLVLDGGTQAMRFDVVRVTADQSLGAYLNSGWMENVDKSSVEELTVNGFPAASATASGDQWHFKVYVLRFGADVYRFIFASRQKTTESDRNARETVNSFRRLTLEEIQAARPLRIKIITVQPGDTVESLAHRMSGVDRPAERFRILNGLEANAQVKVRDRVKIVVD